MDVATLRTGQGDRGDPHSVTVTVGVATLDPVLYESDFLVVINRTVVVYARHLFQRCIRKCT